MQLSSQTIETTGRAIRNILSFIAAAISIGGIGLIVFFPDVTKSIEQIATPENAAEFLATMLKTTALTYGAVLLAIVVLPLVGTLVLKLLKRNVAARAVEGVFSQATQYLRLF
jgi:hypothetical protein